MKVKVFRNVTVDEVAMMLYNDKFADWSFNGAKALAEYFVKIEVETDKVQIIDKEEIRITYSEYSNAVEAAIDNGFECEENEEYCSEMALEFLNSFTTVIPFKGGIIIQNF